MKRMWGMLCCCLSSFIAFAQGDPVVMRINGLNVLRSEFEDSYALHRSMSEHRLTPKEYVPFFVQEWMKVAAAKEAGLDTTLSYRIQHEAVRRQLVKTSLVDTAWMDSCLHSRYSKTTAAKEAGLDTTLSYRIQHEAVRRQLVKTSLVDTAWMDSCLHSRYSKTTGRNVRVQVMQVFRSLPQNMSVRRLEEAKQQMTSLYQSIQKRSDVDFKQWVDKYSDDKEVRWLSPLQATAEFEQHVFSLPVDGVSVLFYMSPLQATAEFEQHVFSLPVDGVSVLFYTPAGLHIVKVVARKELSVDSQVVNERNRWLAGNRLPNQIAIPLVERLKQERGFVPHSSGLKELLYKGETSQTLFTIGGKPYDGTLFKQFASSHPQALERQLLDFISLKELLYKGETSQTLFTIGGKPYDGTLFKQFASSHPQALERQLLDFISKSVLDEASDSIEVWNESAKRRLHQADVAYLVQEITRMKVDDPAAADRAGWVAYFEVHRSHYRWEIPRYKGAVIHCADKKTAKRVKKILKKLPFDNWKERVAQEVASASVGKVKMEQGTWEIGQNSFVDKRVKKILKKLPFDNWKERVAQEVASASVGKVKMEQGTWEIGQNSFVDKLVFKQGEFQPLVSYPFTIVVGNKQKEPEDYREVADRVKKDYRAFLYACWMKELKAQPLVSYPFTIVVGNKQKEPEDYREVADRVKKDYRAFLYACWMKELKAAGSVDVISDVLKTVNNN